MSRAVRLGSWSCRSGTACTVFILPPRGDGARLLLHTWDSPPPFSDDDFADYVGGIRPAIISRAREYLELSGPAAVVELMP
jgi:hypothetical protein